MNSIVAFCYVWSFRRQEPFVNAICNKSQMDNTTGDDSWIGVNIGSTYYNVSSKDTNNFLEKYLNE